MPLNSSNPSILQFLQIKICRLIGNVSLNNSSLTRLDKIFVELNVYILQIRKGREMLTGQPWKTLEYF